ncbi:hypothetical protein C8Q77DRAFT_1160026 [Trametes polyzona]|nr:hypothetical protein C8Q77DRAFT_1160026 [Trametes polyzona]
MSVLASARTSLLRSAAPSLRCARLRLSAARCMSSEASSGELKKTGLYDFHVRNGAKMVPFAGYAMPLSYGNVGAGPSSPHYP